MKDYIGKSGWIQGISIQFSFEDDVQVIWYCWVAKHVCLNTLLDIWMKKDCLTIKHDPILPEYHRVDRLNLLILSGTVRKKFIPAYV